MRLRLRAGDTKLGVGMGLIMALSTFACAGDSEKLEEPAAVSSPAAVEAKEILGPDPCHELSMGTADQPLVLPGKGVVLTRFAKTCITRKGKPGIERDTPWRAMGFPCTGGGGRIETKGNINAPKMVSFLIGTDCRMAPADKATVQKLFEEQAQLPSESKLKSFLPLAVQFWEIPGMPDADSGYAVELRSPPALEGGWKKVKDKDKLRVVLYGRENVWENGQSMFRVEADIRLDGASSFALDIASVKALSDAEVEALKKRCEALRSSKGCSSLN